MESMGRPVARHLTARLDLMNPARRSAADIAHRRARWRDPSPHSPCACCSTGSANDGGRKAAHVAKLPADVREMSLQAAGFDRLRQASNRGFERTLRISSLDIGTIQDVLTTFVRFRDQSRQRENKSEKCDYFDCHLRPPAFDPMGLNTPKLLKSGSRTTPKLNERISEA
jgi:hypothetical protein